jgi:RNA 2',3'-cyclic 3'-phosphodiesterase
MSSITTSHAEAWRCFVGVPIAEELREELDRYVERLKQPPEARSVRWVDAAGLHLTLVFLGSLTSDSLPAVKRALSDVAGRHTAFTVPTGGVGAFPSPHDMRVLWYGVNDSAGRLAALAGDLASALGIESSAFRAHLTLARSREGRRGQVLMATLTGGAGDPPRGEISVDHVELYRSHLGQGPARYEVLAATTLCGPNEVRP